jgi:antitoxin component YwqK of YwqJK toxin-antitoxin module
MKTSNKPSIIPHLLLLALAILLLPGCKGKRTEKAYHDNGNLMYEVSYKGSAKHGLSVYYFADGRKEIEYPFEDNLLNGKVTRWYFNGSIEYEEEYRDNQLEGLSRYFYLNGNISEEKNFHQNALHGPYKAFWETGVKKISGHYTDAMYDGKWEYFNEQGIKVGEGNFEKGSGVMIGYHKNGRIHMEIEYRDNLKHGREATWTDEGSLVSEHFYEFGELIREINRN